MVLQHLRYLHNKYRLTMVVISAVVEHELAEFFLSFSASMDNDADKPDMVRAVELMALLHIGCFAHTELSLTSSSPLIYLHWVPG